MENYLSATDTLRRTTCIYDMSNACWSNIVHIYCLIYKIFDKRFNTTCMPSLSKLSFVVSDKQALTARNSLVVMWIVYNFSTRSNIGTRVTGDMIQDESCSVSHHNTYMSLQVVQVGYQRHTFNVKGPIYSHYMLR